MAFALGSGAAGSGAGGSSASAGASFVGGTAQATETTNASGLATSPSFDANATPGKFTATATVAGVTDPASFSLDNLAGERAGDRPRRWRGRVGDRGRSLRSPLGSRCSADGEAAAGRDGHLRARRGRRSRAPRRSAAGASFVGGSAQATETTDAAGLAVSPRFDREHHRGYIHRHRLVPGTTGVASFPLRNRAGNPTTITAGGGGDRVDHGGDALPGPARRDGHRPRRQPGRRRARHLRGPRARGERELRRPTRAHAHGHRQDKRVRDRRRAGLPRQPKAGGYIVTGDRRRRARPRRIRARQRAPRTVSAAAAPAPKKLRLGDLARVASVGVRTRRLRAGALGARDRDRRRRDRRGARPLVAPRRRGLLSRDRPARHEPAHRHDRPDALRRARPSCRSPRRA